MYHPMRIEKQLHEQRKARKARFCKLQTPTAANQPPPSFTAQFLVCGLLLVSTSTTSSPAHNASQSLTHLTTSTQLAMHSYAHDCVISL
jgi:hypothetical protein